MKIYEIISEARKNPELNPKVSINQEIISAYKKAPILQAINDKNCFVSFTELDKLGINPTSHYATPIGIYAYPANYIIDEIGKSSPMSDLPFAGDSPYANIFSVSGNIIDVSNLYTNDTEEYYKRLIPYIQQRTNTSKEEAEASIKYLRKYANEYAKFADELGGLFWYVIWKLANKLAKSRTIKYTNNQDDIETTSAPIEWNKLFRVMGIDGAIDQGIGIIHTSEPHQAVFFTKNVIKNNKRVYNKYSPETIEQSKESGSNKKQAKKIEPILSQPLSRNEFVKILDDNIDVIPYFTNENVLSKILHLNPELYNRFNDHISDNIIKQAVYLRTENWNVTPYNKRTFGIFKELFKNVTNQSYLDDIIKYYYAGKNNNETDKIKKFLQVKGYHK